LAMHATDDPVRLKVQQVRTPVQQFIVARAADSCNAFAAVYARPCFSLLRSLGACRLS
jgi:hypothetical protein